MTGIPEKITVRLDFTTRELLAHYLNRKINQTASQVMRRALRDWIQEQNAAFYNECQRADAHIKETQTTVAAVKRKAVKS